MCSLPPSASYTTWLFCDENFKFSYLYKPKFMKFELAPLSIKNFSYCPCTQPCTPIKLPSYNAWHLVAGVKLPKVSFLTLVVVVAMNYQVCVRHSTCFWRAQVRHLTSSNPSWRAQVCHSDGRPCRLQNCQHSPTPWAQAPCIYCWNTRTHFCVQWDHHVAKA